MSSWYKALQALSKANKLAKPAKQMSKLNTLSSKVDKMPEGQKKIQALQAIIPKFSKFIPGLKSTITAVQDKITKAQKVKFEVPDSNSTKEFVAMLKTIQKSGSASPEFKKAQAAYKARLKAYGRELESLGKNLKKEAADFNHNIKVAKAFEDYCFSISRILLNFAPVPSLGATFLSMSEEMVSFSGKFGTIRTGYEDLLKKHDKRLGQIYLRIGQNLLWVRKDFSSFDQLKKNEKADKPR